MINNWKAAVLVFMLMILGTAFVRGTNMQASWMKNLAVIELVPQWIIQTNDVLDPPCSNSGTVADIGNYLQDSYQLNPKNRTVLTHLGRVFWLQGHCEEAISQWKQAYTLRGDLGAALELFRMGEYDVLSLDMRLVFANKILNYAESDKSIDAHSLYSRALKLVPEETETIHWQMIGEIAILNNEIDAAALAFAQAATLAPDSADLWIRAGEAWEIASNWEQAETSYQNAIVAQPDSLWPRIKLGNIYQLNGQYQDALRLYFQAKDIAPDYSDPYYHLGVTYYLIQEYSQAQDYLEIAIDFVPEHASAKFQLAQVMYEQGKFKLAERWLLDAVENYPEAPEFWWIQLGDWQLEWHDCESAQKTYVYALDFGANEQLIEQKLAKISNECD